MSRAMGLICAAGLFLSLLLLASCYTYGTEPEFVRGRLSEQPDSIRRATVITAEAFMDQYGELRNEAGFGQPDYRIAIGIQLAVEVVNEGIARTVYVGPDGKVDLPLVGTVKAAGKQLDAFRSELRERYKPFFKGDFQVNVNTDRSVFIAENGRGGTSLAGHATVITADRSLRGRVVDLRGDEYLTEVVFGWTYGTVDLGEKPEWKEVGVIREIVPDPEKGTTETIIILCDLEKLLFGGDTRHNIPIRHRDLVFVPRRRDTLLEELHDSLGYWAGMLNDTEEIRDIIKAMENW